MRFTEMAEHIQDARIALDSARSPEMASALAPVATAHALVVIAECMFRREMREGG